MTETDNLPGSSYSMRNRRDVAHVPPQAWRRPPRPRTAAYTPAPGDLLGDVSLRDPSWRTAERRDLYALAALAFAFASLALGAAVFVSN